MRQRITLACVIALIIYIGLVLEYHGRVESVSGGAGMIELQRAIEGMGGALEAAVLTAGAPIADPDLPERLRARLGWNGAPPPGQERIVELQRDPGGYGVAVHLRLTGADASRWPEQHAALTRALEAEGVHAPVRVTLEGSAAHAPGGLLRLAEAGLDVVGASRRQPWEGERSASVAGWTERLPAGPHEVNVQTAVRELDRGVRLLAAWPALSGDY